MVAAGLLLGGAGLYFAYYQGGQSAQADLGRFSALAIKNPALMQGEGAKSLLLEVLEGKSEPTEGEAEC